MMKVFLVSLIFQGPGNGFSHAYHPMESMEVCLKVVSAAKIQIANGGDSEGAVALFCTNGQPV